MSANDVAWRYRPPSPRTVEYPRAFAGFEFTTGVFWALLWFQPMGMVITLVLGLVAEPEWAFGFVAGGAFVGFPVSVAAALVGAPGAHAIGRALRRSANDRLHLAVFSAYGVTVGTVTAFAAGLLLGRSVYAALLLLPYALAAGVAAPLGWWKASRSALAADAAAGT